MKHFVAFALLATTAPAAGFRWTRSVEAPAGWAVLELPDDVLNACRPGLPDLRLRTARGEDVPYAFAEDVGGASVRRELANVESIPKRETTALLDRGQRPPLARSVTLEIAGENFLKPVTLEASRDGAVFREFARGSIFATSGVRSTTLRFPGNDRRFWRFRFDDRDGDPVQILAVRVEADRPALPDRAIPLPMQPTAGEDSLLVATRLPAANLGVTSFRLSIGEPAFQRRVRVFERVFFRDEVSRRLVGVATVARSPESTGDVEVPVCDPAGKNLEIEIENDDNPSLHVSSLIAIAHPRRLLFFTLDGSPLWLLYGSPIAQTPRYDLTAALRGGVPKSLASATLGAPQELGSPVALSAPPRGAPLDAVAWNTRQPIETPAAGEVAYLDLRDALARQLPSLRIVDAANRPVPHVVEQSSREETRTIRPRASQKGTRTVLILEGLDPSRPPDAVTLFASAPDYFSRDVTVLAEERDARGLTEGQRVGSTRWERLPGQPPRPLTIRLSPSQATVLRAEIENGDNAALTIDRAEIRTPFARIDFCFTPGEKLYLLSGNPSALPPRYDLAMVADRVLSAPGQPASLGPAEQRRSEPLPAWFWAAVIAAALLVGAALVRTLKSVNG